MFYLKRKEKKSTSNLFIQVFFLLLVLTKKMKQDIKKHSYLNDFTKKDLEKIKFIHSFIS